MESKEAYKTLTNCEICRKVIIDHVVNLETCKHNFHHKCLFTALGKMNTDECPTCVVTSKCLSMVNSNQILTEIKYASITEFKEAWKTFPDCVICENEIVDHVVRPMDCKHNFHHKCLFTVLIEMNSEECPTCLGSSKCLSMVNSKQILTGITFVNKPHMFQLGYTFMIDFVEIGYLSLIGLYRIAYPMILKIKLKGTDFKEYIAIQDIDDYKYISRKMAKKMKLQKVKVIIPILIFKKSIKEVKVDLMLKQNSLVFILRILTKNDGLQYESFPMINEIMELAQMVGINSVAWDYQAPKPIMKVDKDIFIR